MYCLWKTQGLTIIPWRKDVIFGAFIRDDRLIFVIQSEKQWKGKILFDQERHRNVLNMPLDYPRINQFPEWFTVHGNSSYRLNGLNNKISEEYAPQDLINGINLEIDQDKTYVFELRIN
jgi:hypothetical protein